MKNFSCRAGGTRTRQVSCCFLTFARRLAILRFLSYSICYSQPTVLMAYVPTRAWGFCSFGLSSLWPVSARCCPRSSRLPCHWRSSDWAHGESFWQITVISISYVVVVGSPSRVTRSFCLQVLEYVPYLFGCLFCGFTGLEVVAAFVAESVNFNHIFVVRTHNKH